MHLYVGRKQPPDPIRQEAPAQLYVPGVFVSSRSRDLPRRAWQTRGNPWRAQVKLIKYTVITIVLAAAILAFWLPRVDRYQTNGEMRLAALKEPVTVLT